MFLFLPPPPRNNIFVISFVKKLVEKFLYIKGQFYGTVNTYLFVRGGKLAFCCELFEISILVHYAAYHHLEFQRTS